MCVQCCHFLRFLKNNTCRHFADLNVVPMPNCVNIGLVVKQQSSNLNNCVQGCHFLSHFLDQHVVPMPKGIKFGS